MNLKVYYPYAVVLAVIASTVVWIITSRRLCAYIRAIRAEGGFNESLDSLIHPQGEEDFRRKIFARRSDFSFKLLTLAAALMLCLRVESLGGVNLIPSFAVGIAFGIVGIRLLGRSTLGISTLVVGIIHSATMLAASIAEFVFLNEHSLSELSKNESLAKEYIPTVVLNAVAIVPFALLLVLMAAAVCTYHRDAVMSECKQSLSTRAVTDKARAFASKFVIWTILGLAVAISRAVDLFFNLNTDVIYVTVENYWGEVLPGSVTLSSVPWFGTVVFIITAIFVGYTAYLGSVMKDEVELYLG